MHETRGAVRDLSMVAAQALFPIPTLSAAHAIAVATEVKAAQDGVNQFAVTYDITLGGCDASTFPDLGDRIFLGDDADGIHLNRNGRRRCRLKARDTDPDFVKWAEARDEAYMLVDTKVEARSIDFHPAQRLNERATEGETLDGQRSRLVTFVSRRNKPLCARNAQICRYVIPSHLSKLKNQAVNLVSGIFGSDLLPTSLFCNVSSYSMSGESPYKFMKFSEDVSGFQRAFADSRERLPHFEVATYNFKRYASWPNYRAESPAPVTDGGPEATLIVKHRRDPERSCAYGEIVHKKFKQNARSRRPNGFGRGGRLDRDRGFAHNIINTFLVDEKSPARDKRC